MRILISCFMPFRERVKNGSQVLARDLKTRLEQALHQTGEVHVVNIPVRWGAVESILGSVLESWQPEVILGLGEGGPSSISIETTGRNIRQGEDVNGAPPPDAWMLENGEPERKGSFSFSWTPEIILSIPLKLSLDAGAYLCNNALYFICGSGCERVGFIHVPPQGDDDDHHYCALYGPILYEILRQNINGMLEGSNTQ